MKEVTVNIALWAIQSLLAIAFVGAGGTKLAKDRATLLTDKRMGWATEFSSSQIKLIALAEVLGGIGLMLPLALGVMPILTPLAAVGLALLMAGAAATHLRRKEPAVIPAILALLSAGVAVGRFVIA
jgi:uncharacterized membrane protein YphA (DoxX/SURF4 family)